MERRLPVYFVVDCSESMIGPPMEAVQQGLATMIHELKSSPLALETAYISIITFSGQAQQIAPLTELLKLSLPKLSVRPGTSIGKALDLLMTCLKREITPSTAEIKGDYRPIVFLLTDGNPTDTWEHAAANFRRFHPSPSTYAIACGPDADTNMLYKITDNVFQISDTSPELFKKFFVWASASIEQSSKRPESDDDNRIDRRLLSEDGIHEAKEESLPRYRKQRYAFIHSLCSKTKTSYLMKFKLNQSGEKYEASGAYPIETLDSKEVENIEPINTQEIASFPPCPICGNPMLIKCTCNALFCNASIADGSSVTCPACSQIITVYSGNFDISQSQG